MDRALSRLKRFPAKLFALFFLDLDSLKSVNDNLGHQVGDALLVEFARRLKSCVRPHDLTARLGGDEFTVLLEDLRGHQEAMEVAERVLETMRQPFGLDRGEVSTVASIGIAFSDSAEPTIDGIVKAADSAMYAAKLAGKGRYEIFREGIQHGR